MSPADLHPDRSYADAEGNVRRIDSLEPGVVRYTVTECATWPGHVGKSYTAGPKWFAELVVATLEPEAKQS